MTDVVVSLPGIREVQVARVGDDADEETYTLTAGAATITLDPTGVDWCYRFTEHGPDGRVRFCTVPNVPSITYASLDDVDPLTLLVDAEPPTSAWEAVAAAAIDAANAAVAAVAGKAASVGVVAGTVENYPGLDPTGVADSTDALQDWLDDIPDGGIGELVAGTFRARGLTITGKSAHLRVRTATFVQAVNGTILTATGRWDSFIGVTTLDTVDVTDVGGTTSRARLTLASSPSWSQGDAVKLVSDDKIPEARPGDDGTEKRLGEFLTVDTVVGNVVTMTGALQDTGYVTNLRAARMLNDTITIDRWTSETPTSGLATWTSGQLHINSMRNPIIGEVRINQGAGFGVRFTSCLGYQVTTSDVRNLKNDTGAGQYGYAIYDVQSEHGRILGHYAQNVRHAFTDDTSWVAAGGTDPSAYGRSRGAEIHGTARATRAGAWDTHGAGVGHAFFVQAFGCPVGIQARGKDHRFYNPKIRSCTKGAWFFTEPDVVGVQMSHGHEIINPDIAGVRHGVHVEHLALDTAKTTVTIRGGKVQAVTAPLRTDYGMVRLSENPTFSFSAANTTGVKALDAFNGRFEIVDAATADMRGVGASGSTVRPVRLNDAACRLTGDGTLLVLISGVKTRNTVAVLGTGAAEGVCQIRLRADDSFSSGVFSSCTTSSWCDYQVATGAWSRLYHNGSGFVTVSIANYQEGLDNKATLATTVTAAAGLTINAAVSAVATTGYAANGDGGAATYKRVGSQPAHLGRFQSADGAWWELMPETGGFNVKALGATGDGTTDDGPAFDAAVALCNLLGNVSATANKPLGIVVPGGAYNVKAAGIRAVMVSNVSVKCDPWSIFIHRDGPTWTLGDSATIIENFSVEGGQPRTSTLDALGTLGANCAWVFAVNAARIYIDRQRMMRCQIFKGVSNLSLSTIYIRDVTGSGLVDRSWIYLDTSSNPNSGAAGLFVINCGGYAYVPPSNPTFHPKVVTGATQANPVVVTAASHGFATGARVRFGDIVGMTELNGVDATVTVINANSFSLDGVNGAGFGAYSSGGFAAELLWTWPYDSAIVEIKGHWDTAEIDGGLYQHWPWLWKIEATGAISFVWDKQVSWDYGGSGRYNFILNGGSISQVQLDQGWTFTFNDDWIKVSAPGAGLITDLTIRGHTLGMSGKSFISDAALDKIINLEIDGLRVMGCGRARVGTSYLIYPGNGGSNVSTIRGVRCEAPSGYFVNPQFMAPDVGLKLGASLRWAAENNEIEVRSGGTYYDIPLSTSSAAGQRRLRGNRCRTIGVKPEYIPATASASPPATDTAVTNHSGMTQTVYLYGGTMTAVKRNGVQVMTGAGPFSLDIPPDDSFSVVYSVAPTMVVSYSD